MREDWVEQQENKLDITTLGQEGTVKFRKYVLLFTIVGFAGTLFNLSRTTFFSYAIVKKAMCLLLVSHLLIGCTLCL